MDSSRVQSNGSSTVISSSNKKIMNEYALDLKVARRKSGLTQKECAHLLGTDQRYISLIETGEKLPSIYQICALSFVYGRSVESLLCSVFDDTAEVLVERLETLPESRKDWLGRFNRHNTLSALALRLRKHNQSIHGS